MYIRDWLKTYSADILSETPQQDAEILVAERLVKNRSYVVAFDDAELPSAVLEQLAVDVEKLSTGYPLAYVLGKKSFWDMELMVTEATLIPRADTEILIECVERTLPIDSKANIIDLGTGSGAIAIALSRIFTQATIVATDMSADALAVAQGNAKEWQGSEICFMQQSWLEGCQPSSFDVIVSNPPYIVEGDSHLPALSHEPITALTAPNNGLADIMMIISQAQQVLTDKGWLFLEHGYDQGAAVRELFAADGWDSISTHCDLGGNERVTMAQWQQ